VKDFLYTLFSRRRGKRVRYMRKTEKERERKGGIR